MRNEVLQKCLQRVEHRRDVGGAVAGVILFDQRVIGVEAEYAGAQSRLFAHQGHDAFQRRQEARPVVLGAQVAPQLFAAHAGFHLALDEFRRQAGEVGIGALQFAQRRLLFLVQRFAFRGSDPVCDLRRGRPGVVDAGQRRHRLGAFFAAAHRHVGRFVGAEDGQRMFQRLDLAQVVVKFCEGHFSAPGISKAGGDTKFLAVARASRPGRFDRWPEAKKDPGSLRGLFWRTALLQEY